MSTKRLRLDKSILAGAVAHPCQRRTVLDMVHDFDGFTDAPVRKSPAADQAAAARAGEVVQRTKDSALHEAGLIGGWDRVKRDLDAVLRDASEGEWLSEASFALGEKGRRMFLQALGTDGESPIDPVTFRPDYVIVGWRPADASCGEVVAPDGSITPSARGRCLLRVVDAKAAISPSDAQRAELATYVLALSCWLAEQGLDSRFAVSARPSIYPGIEPLPLEDLVRTLDLHALAPDDIERLVRSFGAEVDKAYKAFGSNGLDVPTSFALACQGCAYFDKGDGACLNLARKKEDLGLAGIRDNAQEHLRSVTGKDAVTLSDLAAGIPVSEDLVTWPTERSSAALAGEPVRLGQSRSAWCSRRGDLDIGLAFEWDVHTDRCIGIGIEAWLSKSLSDLAQGKPRFQQEVFISSKRSADGEQDLIQSAFIWLLAQVMAAQNLLSTAGRRKEELRVSFAVLDRIDVDRLAAVCSRLGPPRNIGKWSQDSVVTWTSLLGALWSPLAVTVVRSALLDSFALPHPAFSVSEMANWIGQKSVAPDREQSKYARDHHGPGMAWLIFPSGYDRPDPRRAEWLASALRSTAYYVRRLALYLATNNVSSHSAPELGAFTMRLKDDGPAFLAPSQFGRFAWALRRAELDAADCQVIQSWLRPLASRLADGSAVLAQRSSNPRVLVPDPNRSWQLAPRDEVVICPEGDTTRLFERVPKGESTAEAWTVLRARVQPLGDGGIGVAIPSDARQIVDGARQFTFELPRRSLSPTSLLGPFARSLIDLGKPSFAPLEESAATGGFGDDPVPGTKYGDGGVGFDVVFHAGDLACEPSGIIDLDDSCLSGLDESQRSAVQNVLGKRLGLIWGPPGTGKSSTLARLIGAWFAAQSESAVAWIVTPTYAALDRLIEKVLEVEAADVVLRVRSDQAEQGSARLSQVVDVPRSTLKRSPSQIRPHIDRTRVIVATVPGQVLLAVSSLLRNGRPGPGNAAGVLPEDSLLGGRLVVIDEASQVRLSDVPMALSGARRDAQIVVAGDPKQLPPVTSVVPVGEAGRITSSLWSHLAQADVKPDKLDVNYRSDGGIVESLHRLGYEPSYRANAPVPIPPVSVSPDAPEVVRRAVRAEGPRVRSVLVDDPFARGSSVVEAEMVAKIVQAFWMGRGSLDAETFFSRRVGVVAAHRAQRRCVQNVLARALSIDPTLFRSVSAVDTTERFQGGEREVIVVTYGVGDPDKIAGEEEFLYDLERSVVALSRARALVVVVASRALVERASFSSELRRSRDVMRLIKEVEVR